MYYLYRHTRLDKYEPFYIGIGKIYEKGKNIYEMYKRAFDNIRRTSYWKNIINKTKYEVEIMLESESLEFIKEKEIEFIKFYGRKDIKEGSLVNFTNGGDGTHGLIHKKETIEKIRKSSIGKEITSNIIIYQYNLKGEFIKKWSSIKHASLFCNVHISTLQKIIRKKVNNNYCNGFYWFDKKQDTLEVKPFKIINRNSKINMIDPETKKIVKTFESKKEAGLFLGKSKISGFLKNRVETKKIGYGYLWEEVNNE